MPASIAARVMAWQRRMGGAPGPLGASGEQSNGEPVQVELFIGGTWVDITSNVMVRDDQGQISITKGIRDEGNQAEAGTASFPLKNQDGRFSPRNPLGAYYGRLGRNTPIRVSVPNGTGGKSYRLWGEVSEWPASWEPTGTDVWVDVNANGTIRRLAQGPAPERSVIYNAIADPPLTNLVAYWPCEDATGATTVASALNAGSPMRFAGTPALAAYSGFGASDPLPTLTGASLTGGVTEYDDSTLTQYQVRYLLYVPAAGFNNGDVISRVRLQPAAVGNVEYLDIIYNDPPGGLGSYGGPGTIAVVPYDGDQNPLGFSGTVNVSMDVRGRRLRVSMEVSNSGSNQNVTLQVLDVDSGLTDSATMTTGANATRVRSVALAPATLGQTVGAPGMAAGHVTVQTTITPITDLGAAVQPTGETAGRRIQRLCGEAGIAFDWIGDLDDTTRMGPESKANTLSLVQECALADGGLLYENPSTLGLGYRTRTSLYNQDPALTLNYPSGQLAQIPTPVEDDRYVQNKVTVTVGGVSATYEETSGTLGTALPPAGVGTYGQDITLNLAASDTQTLQDQAAWRVHLGTVDEARFPQISVNLAHPSITADMRRAILAMRAGDRVQITNPPAWLPPNRIDQLVLGISETITRFEHRLTFQCAPASPYSAIGYLDTTARADTDGTVLAAAVDATATSVPLLVTAGSPWITSTDYPGDFPFDLRFGGEVVTVNALTLAVTDDFNRTTSGGWGTADSGQAWTVTGTAADYTVSAGRASIAFSAVNSSRLALLSAPTADIDMYADITTDVTATGASIVTGPVIRATDNNNLYQCRVDFSTSNTISVSLRSRISGVETILGTYAVPFGHTPLTYIRVRFQVIGSTLRARIWSPSASPEPSGWHLTASDSALTTPASIGFRSFTSSGNTNVAPQVLVDSVKVVNAQTCQVTRSVNGVAKAHAAGEDVRLANPTIIAL